MKNDADGTLSFTLFSPITLETIEKTRSAGGRAFLFCARRGLAPLVVCADCGSILRCPRSGSPLALQRIFRNGVEERWLVSSVSGYKRKADELCPQCGSWRLQPRGIGIQQVYDELVTRLGSQDIILFDHHTASTRKKASALIDAFNHKKKTILLGTALALPYLHTLVDFSAVVNMDALRAIPSWRQQEESLGILLTLREKTEGYVFIQTRSENDDVIRYAKNGTIDAYYTDELAVRKQFAYPPYFTFIHLTWQKQPDDMLGSVIAETFAPFDIAIYGGAPPAENSLGYGLIRVPSADWPQDALVDALRSLPPSVRIIINPDRIV